MAANVSEVSSDGCYSDSSIYPSMFMCFDLYVSSVIFEAFTLINLVVLLPLCVFILWTGFQPSSVTSQTSVCSDVFVYYMATLEIFNILALVVESGSIFFCSPLMLTFGYYLCSFTYPVLSYLHCLTCMERYMAVVHPITYLGLRKAAGLRVRKISLGAISLLGCSSVGVTALFFPQSPSILALITYAIISILVSSSSLAVFIVMIGLKLKKVGGAKEQMDKSKLRAFYKFIAISGALILRSCGLVFYMIVIFQLEEGDKHGRCIMSISAYWLFLPSSLVPLLLFLHRAGKLPCF